MHIMCGIEEKLWLHNYSTFRIQVDDQILEVDGVSLVAVSREFSDKTLSGTGNHVK